MRASASRCRDILNDTLKASKGGPVNLCPPTQGNTLWQLKGSDPFIPSLHVNQASRMHYMGDYLQEQFVFTQMLIILDKLKVMMEADKQIVCI